LDTKVKEDLFGLVDMFSMAYGEPVVLAPYPDAARLKAEPLVWNYKWPVDNRVILVGVTKLHPNTLTRPSAGCMINSFFTHRVRLDLHDYIFLIGAKAPSNHSAGSHRWFVIACPVFLLEILYG
jgi:hypothetical protein